MAAGYQTRERFLSELTLDPPEATGADAEAPFLDEDYLILSTIHSAKGQEWSAVFVLSLVDGCIPSDMAAGSEQEIEEERRLLYVAMTRAKRHLHLIHPIRFYRSQQQRRGDAPVFAPFNTVSFRTRSSIDLSASGGPSHPLRSLSRCRNLGALMWQRRCATCGDRRLIQ
jgi:DNA helicase-2/ATP-dependent DNA helicase PcrA